MQKINRIVLSLLTAVALYSITATFADAPPSVDKEPQGLVASKANPPTSHGFGVFCNPYTTDWDDPEKTIKLLKELGVKNVFTKIRWKSIEVKKGSFSEEGWKVHDKLVNSLTDCGINVSTLIAGTPTWAIDPKTTQGNWKGKKFGPPPKDPKDLADFVSVAVKRYKNKVTEWAFFNAPQNRNHWTEPTHLAELYRAGYEAVKREQPDCPVVMSGLEGKWPVRKAYLEAFLKAGGGKYVDAYDFHILLNAFPFTKVEFNTNLFRGVLKKFGEDKKPIHYGAIGWPSSFNPPKGWRKNRKAEGWKPFECVPTTPEIQASRLVTTMVLGKALGVESIFWTSTRNRAPESGIEHEKYVKRRKGRAVKVSIKGQRTTGIVEYDYQPKPSYYALKTLIEKIEGAEFVRRLDIGRGGRGCMFLKGGAFTAVFWRWKGERTIDLSSKAKSVTVLDLYGKNAQTIPIVEGKFTLNVTTIPIYLQGDIEDINIAPVHTK